MVTDCLCNYRRLVTHWLTNKLIVFFYIMTKIPSIYLCAQTWLLFISVFVRLFVLLKCKNVSWLPNTLRCTHTAHSFTLYTAHSFNSSYLQTHTYTSACMLCISVAFNSVNSVPTNMKAFFLEWNEMFLFFLAYMCICMCIWRIKNL